MSKKLLLLGSLLAITAFGIGKREAGPLGVGSALPHASAILDTSSTTKGGRPCPLMTSTQRDAISSPATGLCVTNSTTNKLNVYNGSGWDVLATGGVSLATATKTTTYTLTTADAVIFADATGGAFALNLPTAVGIAGQKFAIIKIDSSTNAITITPNGAQTINGALTKKAATQWERWEIVADGSNWVSTSHTYPQDWVAFTMTITGGGSFAKATTRTYDQGYFMRQGGSGIYRYNYQHTSNTGANAGSSTGYLFGIPHTIDTARLAAANTNIEALGSASAISAATKAWGFVAYGSTTQLTMLVGTETTAIQTVGNGWFATTGTQVNYNFTTGPIPIVGWED